MKNFVLLALPFCTSVSAQELTANLSDQNHEITLNGIRQKTNWLVPDLSLPEDPFAGMGTAFAGIDSSHLEALNNWLSDLSRESS